MTTEAEPLESLHSKVARLKATRGEIKIKVQQSIKARFPQWDHATFNAFCGYLGQRAMMEAPLNRAILNTECSRFYSAYPSAFSTRDAFGAFNPDSPVLKNAYHALFSEDEVQDLLDIYHRKSGLPVSPETQSNPSAWFHEHFELTATESEIAEAVNIRKEALHDLFSRIAPRQMPDGCQFGGVAHGQEKFFVESNGSRLSIFHYEAEEDDRLILLLARNGMIRGVATSYNQEEILHAFYFLADVRRKVERQVLGSCSTAYSLPSGCVSFRLPICIEDDSEHDFRLLLRAPAILAKLESAH